MSCKAKQYSDQMICDTCALQWDVNDPDPPECRGDDRTKLAHDAAIKNINEVLKDATD